MERAGRLLRIPRKEVPQQMKLKPNGAKLINFVIEYANGDMDRWAFDLDYSGYVIDYFPEFEKEHPRLSRKFVDTIERTYTSCSWLPDDRFREAIADAVDEFLGRSPKTDIY